MSGIRKFVLTPPIVTGRADSRGKPSFRSPMSVEVPPTSTTIEFLTPAKKAAPRMLFVGPDEQVRIGCMAAASVVMSVPSF